MSSVSVLPPHPPSMSAARKLALALAESAQKASAGPPRRGPLQRAEVPPVQERPPRPSVLDLDVYPQADSHWQMSGHDPTDGHCCPHPFHFLPAYGRSELLADLDGQESSSNFTPNVSPLGSGSLDDGSAERSNRRGAKEFREVERGEAPCQSVGVSTPIQPVCLTQSPPASPVYVNADSINVLNFRAVLAETAMPASVEEVLPRHLQPCTSRQYSPEEDRPENVSGSHHNRPFYPGRAPARPGPRPDALPQHLLGLRGLCRQPSESHYSTFGVQRPLSPQCVHYRRGEERHAGGYHRHQGAWPRPEDRSAGQPAIRRARSFHAPQVSHYALAGRQDDMFHLARTSSQRYQRLIQTSVQPVQPQLDRTPVRYRYGPCAGATQPGEPCYYQEDPCQQSADRHRLAFTVRSTSEQSDYYNCSPRRLPPANRKFGRENSSFYEARDSEGSERAAYIPVQQGGKPRCQAASPLVSPRDSLASPTSPRNRDIVHTRSKSDPGNACLLTASRADSQNSAGAPSALSNPDVIRRYGHQSGAEPGAPRRVQMERPNPPLRKVPSLPERSCSKLRGLEQNSRGYAQGRDQDRPTMSHHVGPTSGILRRSCRSQSTRENRHYHQHARSPLDPEHPGSAQLTRRTQSTKVRPTQYEHVDACYAGPRPKPSRSGRAAGGYLPPGQGCMSPRGQRLLSNALGREAFHHTALRSKAGVFD